MCGVPGSGKSYIAKHLNQDIIYISRDDIRFSLIGENATEKEYFSKEVEVFRSFIKEIQNLLDHNYDVIADATHINWASRKKVLNKLNLDGVRVVPIVVEASYETCVKRNNNRNGLKKVPNAVIKRMMNNYTDPKDDPFNYAGYAYVSNEEDLNLKNEIFGNIIWKKGR